MAYGQPLDQSPLTPAVFHILLALSRGAMHGLGIADAIEHETAGAMRLGPGTLYRSLKDMAGAELVVAAADPAGEDPRRKYYRLTESGGAVLEAEAMRLARLVEIARDRNVIPGRV